MDIFFNIICFILLVLLLLQLLKILLPHIGLNVLLLSYIAFGAFIFIRLEAESELNVGNSYLFIESLKKVEEKEIKKKEKKLFFYRLKNNR